MAKKFYNFKNGLTIFKKQLNLGFIIKLLNIYIKVGWKVHRLSEGLRRDRREQSTVAGKSGSAAPHWRRWRRWWDFGWCSRIQACWASQRRRKDWIVVGFCLNPNTAPFLMLLLICTTLSVSTAPVPAASSYLYVWICMLRCCCSAAASSFSTISKQIS